MKISVDEAQQQLEEVIALAQHGDEIIISSKSGSVKLVALPNTAEKIEDRDWQSIFGVMKDQITYEEGWDAPLTSDEVKEIFG
ncbi:type II toxin-antitoxin system Phd/YefM family antitoxin [Halomonas alkaliantarctica]|uniref:type II toxin-antitoxin system Phd/YefM family antitoxin n=1 Tax=Halomonas alkaliantarctica TaxID=232346 RepID=UPI00265AFCD3|nr:type II toxin-antitoxin system prevent-host-death family antitoxin [Halomonas alkaliantarctica]